MNLYLRVMPGADEPFDYRCESAVVIGRSQTADLSIPTDRFISKRHARVFEETGAWYIEDLNSRNATLLNGHPIEARTQVFEGDVIRLSDCRIEVKFVPGSDDSTEVYRPAVEVLHESDSKDRLNETPGEPGLKRYAERLALLNEVHRLLANQLSREELFELILDSAFTHLRAEEGIILVENAEGSFDRVATRRKRNVTGEYIYSRRLTRLVAKQGMAALVHDVQDDEQWAQAQSLMSQGIRSIIAAPLHHPGGRPGMIVLATRAAVRNFTQEDMELLVSLASVAALQMRNLDLHEEASRQQQLQKELELARTIQTALFPDKLPRIPGYELDASNRPSRTVSGDLYRIEDREDGRECVLLVADVSGKGIGASLLTASLEALVMGPIEMGRSPEEICGKVSRRLYARTPPERFATAFLAVLEPETGVVRYTNAGHNPALVVRANGEVEELWATGIPLGMLVDADYATNELTLSPGDTVVIYTDGIIEAKNPRDEEYELRRLVGVCRKNRARSAKELARAVTKDLDAFTCGVPYEDDRTLVIARRV